MTEQQAMGALRFVASMNVDSGGLLKGQAINAVQQMMASDDKVSRKFTQLLKEAAGSVTGQLFNESGGAPQRPQFRRHDAPQQLSDPLDGLVPKQQPQQATPFISDILNRADELM